STKVQIGSCWWLRNWNGLRPGSVKCCGHLRRRKLHRCLDSWFSSFNLDADLRSLGAELNEIAISQRSLLRNQNAVDERAVRAALIDERVTFCIRLDGSVFARYARIQTVVKSDARIGIASKRQRALF